MKRAIAIFKGRVQGVFFRANTERKANEIGLRGYVRNLKNGDVELVIEGREEDINKLIKFCSEEIPNAKVVEREIKWQNFKGEFEEFEIRY